MGASMSWLVCDAKHLDSLKSLLGAIETSDRDAMSLCVTITPDDRAFIYEARGRRWTFDQDEERRRLSIGRDVVFCMLEEHVMASEIANWNDGVEVWRVEHDSEQGIYHLDARGDLPPSFEAVRKARFDEQDRGGGEGCDVDFIFSVPMDLAAELTGYDGGSDEPEGEYQDWACPQASKPLGFFARLFGKRSVS